ncbi:MAG: M23 family metallopeptidase [Desulfonatronovibrio sp.]
MKKILVMTLFFTLAWIFCAHAVTLVVPEQVGQGEPFRVEISSRKIPEKITVFWMDKVVDYPVDLPGKQMILLGAGLDRSGDYPLELVFDLPEGTLNKTVVVSIVDKDFPAQHLSLPESMVTPPQEVIDRIIKERNLTVNALNTLTHNRYWTEEFVRPVPGEISSRFGVRRFLNDQPRSPHKGVDFRGAEGTPVKALDSGQVILTGDFYYGGQTVIMDHGLGLQSLYMHLSKIEISEGDYISRGEQVGLVGMTGRSTGPHLHFGVYILGEAVDPLYLFDEGN